MSDQNQERTTVAITSVEPDFANEFLSKNAPDTPDDVVTIQEKAKKPNELYVIREVKDVPAKFLERAYKAICQSFLSFGFPTVYSNEAAVFASMAALLKSLCVHLSMDEKLSSTVRLKVEKPWKWGFNEITLTGRPDYELDTNRKISSPVLLIVECKCNSFNSAMGLLQCQMFAKRIYEKENRKVSFSFTF